MRFMMDMDQEVARKLFEECAFFLFLGVPEETEFGIDMKAWNTTDNFRGIKMIPPGIHFIHYSSVNNNAGDISPRSGFMHNFKKKEFLVKLWDKKLEDISKDEVTAESIEQIKRNIFNLDRNLAPYPYEIWNTWKLLSNHITEDLAKRLSPAKGIIRSSVELLSMEDKDRPRGDSKNINETPNSSKKQRLSLEDIEKELLPDLKPVPGTALRFTKIPREKYPNSATPQEITKHNLDQTYTFELLIAEQVEPIGIIGELQFAYICFLIGHSLDAFEHWKKIVSIICSCDDAIKKYTDIYFNFIKTIEIQLYEMPEEFLTDIVMNNNLVYKKLRELFITICSSTGIDSRLVDCVDRFKESLTNKFEWDFSGLEKEEDDEKPVVVTL